MRRKLYWLVWAVLKTLGYYLGRSNTNILINIVLIFNFHRFRYFQRTLNESEISLKDSETVWNTLPYDFASHEAFQFLREHWKEIQNHYGQHESLMKSILSGMLSKLSTKTELIEVNNK